MIRNAGDKAHHNGSVREFHHSRSDSAKAIPMELDKTVGIWNLLSRTDSSPPMLIYIAASSTFHWVVWLFRTQVLRQAAL